MKTNPQHEARRDAFDQACAALAREQDQHRRISMATSTKSKSPKTPQAPANGQVASHSPPPPATETRVLPDGTIERYAHGKLIKTTPPPQANGKAPAAKAAPKPAKKSAAPKGPKRGEAFYVAQLGSEDIWHFKPIDPADPSRGMTVTHYEGYDVLREHRRSATFATKLYHDLLAAGFVYIDGVTHRLVDEMV